MRETWVQSLGQEDPLEKGMATHSSILVWRIPWMEEPGGLPSMGSQRVGQDWVTSLSLSLLNQVTCPSIRWEGPRLFLPDETERLVFFWVLWKRNKATVKSDIHSSSFWPIAAWKASACIGQIPSAVKRVRLSKLMSVEGRPILFLQERASWRPVRKGPTLKGNTHFREYYLLAWWTGIKHLFCGRHSSRCWGNSSEKYK